MKCDLHVHTIHSGMCTVPVARNFCRESYNHPVAVYEKLKRCGMDLVTITDHDSIDAAEALRHHRDFFLSEEATCIMPSGNEVHIGIYDITERQHMEIQSRRPDFFSLIAYMQEQHLLFSVNHLLSGLTGPRDQSDYAWFESVFPCFETLNGAMPKASNDRAAHLAGHMGKAPTAGSDAHTMRGVGATFTSVPGANSKPEFLAAIRQGRGLVQGESGSRAKLTKDVLTICTAMMAERWWTLLFLPVLAVVPAVTLVNCWMEASFAETWFGRSLSLKKSDGLRSWNLGKVPASAPFRELC
jgi:predicted metal-dependent phosphoesterase TrpH